MGDVRELKVWHKAMELSELVYRETGAFPSDERFGLVSQMRRAAVSVPSNLAEGEGRVGRDGRRFLDIAYGSTLELETQIELSLRLGFVDEAAHARLLAVASETARMLNGLKAARDRFLTPGVRGQGAGVRGQGAGIRNLKPETRNLEPDNG